MTTIAEKSEVSHQQPEAASPLHPVTSSPCHLVTPSPASLSDLLLAKLRLNFGERIGLTSPVKSLHTGSGDYLLSECLRRHFQLNGSVAADIIATSSTVADIAAKLAEVKGVAEPSLFSAPTTV